MMVSITIADQVFLGFCDVQAAGLQALASLVPKSDNCHQVSAAVELCGLSHDLPQVFSSTDDCPLSLHASSSSRAVVCTYLDAANNAMASTILINAAVPLGSQAQVIASLLQLLQGNGLGSSSSESPNRCLHIVAAVHTGGMHVKPDGLYGLCVNGAASCLAGSSLAVEQLPSGMRVKDPFLATLLDLGTASGLPMNLLAVSGFKPSLSAEATEDLSAAAVLGQAVASCVQGVEYDAGVCARLVLQHRWFDARQTGFEAMYV